MLHIYMCVYITKCVNDKKNCCLKNIIMGVVNFKGGKGGYFYCTVILDYLK